MVLITNLKSESIPKTTTATTKQAAYTTIAE